MYATYRLVRSQKIPTTIEKAWDFFLDPHNLRKITPPWLDFRIDPDTPEEMYLGMVIKYTVKPLLGIPVFWTTEIRHLRPPHFFVDEQRVGPYRWWYHQHLLKEIDGGVLAEDQVDYAVPFGPLGRLVHPLLIRPKLEAIFDYRRRAVSALFGSMPS